MLLELLNYGVAYLAVARLSMLIPEDRIFLRVRQWMIRLRGEDSLLAYFAVCVWCISFWWALLIMPPVVIYLWGWDQWLLAVVSVPAASLIAGLFTKARE